MYNEWWQLVLITVQIKFSRQLNVMFQASLITTTMIYFINCFKPQLVDLFAERKMIEESDKDTTV